MTRVSNKANPAIVAAVTVMAISAHIRKIDRRAMPACWSPVVAAIDSGRFDRKTAAITATLTLPPSIRLTPITIPSGIPSSTVPSTIARGLPSACCPPERFRSDSAHAVDVEVAERRRRVLRPRGPRRTLPLPPAAS